MFIKQIPTIYNSLEEYLIALNKHDWRYHDTQDKKHFMACVANSEKLYKGSKQGAKYKAAFMAYVDAFTELDDCPQDAQEIFLTLERNLEAIKKTPIFLH